MKVRTTLRPQDEIEVDEGEYLDLKRQGLLLPEQKTPEPPKTQKKEN